MRGERFPVDTPLTTSGGATFTSPSGWEVTFGPDKCVLNPPEGDSHLALVDVDAGDAASAVAGAWASYPPGARRPLKIAMACAPCEGWKEGHVFVYETSPNEKAVVSAQAWRAAETWTVAIIEATEATYEKRIAAFSLILKSLRPKGYQREMFTGRKARLLDAKRVVLITDFVRDLMQQFGIPGVGLSLIDAGKIVFEGGFGVKTSGKPDPVDANTLFLAASNSKALTTLLLALLADEKKLRWDLPVTEVYPGFALGDAETTRQVLVKHLVGACTGLPRQDCEWLFNFATATPASVFAWLASMQPTSRFGEVFQYSNLMAAAAGYVAAHAISPHQELGAAYDEAMRAKVFEPLAMTCTTFDFSQAMHGNFASPHGDDVDGNTRPARMDHNYSAVPFRPAGGVWTSARDLPRYLQMELARGELPSGKRLLSEENLLERRRAQVSIGEDAIYGMGLEVSTLRHPGCEPRRGSVRIPERHDLSSQPRGRGRRPHELRLRGLSYWSLAAPPTRSAF